MLNGNYEKLYKTLLSKIEDKRMYQDPLHTLAFGTDASFYRLIPKIVIKAINQQEVSFVLQECAKLNLPVTFRAGGTSLSGQAISDSVLLIAGSHWNNYTIIDDGLKIKLQPGLTGGKVNSILAPYGRKIGPDPASVNSAMIGGIAANNASGMCCGTAENSYKTIDSMSIVFADGTLLNTADEVSINNFKTSNSELLTRITDLASVVKNNKKLAERITEKFKMKNTTGYSLNALVDYSDPIEVIEHLMIGSEGTLGFIADITYKTVAELPNRASSLMIFPDIEKTCNAVLLLKNAPVSAVELIDRAGLRSIENQTGMPSYLLTLSANACAILVETRAISKELLANQIKQILNIVQEISSEIPIAFTDIPAEYNSLWKIRKGLFPSVGAIRKNGTTVIIEDVTFPLERLAEATLDLQSLLKKWNYNEAVLFGHALNGNLHFVFTQDFGTQKEIDRYSNFMTEIANLVVHKYDGSLKAEHGTGRNMAPFVELEWGSEAYQLMKSIKNIFDPNNLLNPGVILNDDSKIHLKNLKPIPEANEIIDKCIECGFCENNCVSADLTLTPRQRIVVYREIAELKKNQKDSELLTELEKVFEYAGDQTCATDGLCATSCPVKIDTGKLIKELRSEKIGNSHKTSNFIANNIKGVTAAARVLLSGVNIFHTVLGTSAMSKISKSLHNISRKNIPLWNASMPIGAKKIDQNSSKKQNKKVVYFPSCINRSMGVSKDNIQDKQLSEVMISLCNKAGFEVVFPEKLDNACCGMPFSSKGYKNACSMKSNDLEKQLLIVSENGKYPIVTDMSPCAYTMKENFKSTIKLYDVVEFISEHIINNIKINPLDETVTLFSVCSSKKMELEDTLINISKKCAVNVHIAEANCCGFAGDKGFLVPELNTHGLKDLKKQIPCGVTKGYSTSRTCEIGLSSKTGIPYKSIAYLVDEVSLN